MQFFNNINFLAGSNSTTKTYSTKKKADDGTVKCGWILQQYAGLVVPASTVIWGIYRDVQEMCFLAVKNVSCFAFPMDKYARRHPPCSIFSWQGYLRKLI